MFEPLAAIMLKFITVALLIAGAEAPGSVTCTAITGPIPLNTEEPITVELKCCSKGGYILDPKHPVDSNGDLICSNQEKL